MGSVMMCIRVDILAVGKGVSSCEVEAGIEVLVKKRAAYGLGLSRRLER